VKEISDIKSLAANRTFYSFKNDLRYDKIIYVINKSSERRAWNETYA